MVSKAWVCDVLCFYNTCSVITQTRRSKNWNSFVNKRIYGNSGYGDHIPWARSVVEMAVLLDTAWPHHHRLHNVSLKILTWLGSRLQMSAREKKQGPLRCVTSWWAWLLLLAQGAWEGKRLNRCALPQVHSLLLPLPLAEKTMHFLMTSHFFNVNIIPLRLLWGEHGVIITETGKIDVHSLHSKTWPFISLCTLRAPWTSINALY